MISYANSVKNRPIFAERAQNDAAGNEIGRTYATKAELPTVDQTYDATSTNAQSGVAVAQAVASAGGTRPELPALSMVANKDVFRFEFQTSSYDPSTDSDVSSLGTWTKVTADPSRNVWDLEAASITNGFKNKFTSSKSLFRILNCYLRTINMSSYFYGCTGLTDFFGYFILGSTSTNEYRYMSSMFYQCVNLENIEIHSCSSLGQSNIDPYDLGSRASDCMCGSCGNLQRVSFGGVNATTVVNLKVTGSLQGAFYDCIRLETINGLSISNVTNLDSCFLNCRNLKSIYPYMYIDCSGSAQNAFKNCGKLNTPLSYIKATNFNETFRGCYSFTNIGVIDLANCTNASAMLAYCSSLVDAKIINTSTVTNMEEMLVGCYSLLKLPELDYTSVTNVNKTFYYSKNILSGMSAIYNTLSTNPSITTHTSTFTNCGSNTVTGAAELAQIPASWGGTGS